MFHTSDFVNSLMNVPKPVLTNLISRFLCVLLRQNLHASQEFYINLCLVFQTSGASIPEVGSFRPESLRDRQAGKDHGVPRE